MPEEINHAADLPKRNSFVFFTSYVERFRSLSNEQLGALVRAMADYQITGEIPHITDQAIALAFGFVKVDLDLNTEKYYASVLRNRENGKKGGRPKAENPTKPSGLSETQTNPENPMEPKKADNDNDNDNENDNENDNVSVTENEERRKEERRKALILKYNLHPYGKYNNVLLTKDQFEDLKKNCSEIYLTFIDTVSEYRFKNPIDPDPKHDYNHVKMLCNQYKQKQTQKKGEINATDNQTGDKGEPFNPFG